MKVATKLMLLVLVLATFALPMVITGPNGRPLMTLGDWMPAVSLADKRPLNDSVVASTSADVMGSGQMQDSHTPVQQSQPVQKLAMPGQMYKWQDKKGRWHFSNEKPNNHTDAIVEDLPEIKNVMEAAVNRGENSSTMSLPDFGDAGALLERLQRSAAGSEQ